MEKEKIINIVTLSVVEVWPISTSLNMTTYL